MKYLAFVLIILSSNVYADLNSRMQFLVNQLETVNSLDYCEPTRFEAGGVNEVAAGFRRLNVRTIEDMKNQSEEIVERYLYSPRWGWIDLKHFTMAAHKTNHPLLSASMVLALGEMVELSQLSGEKNSSFSYEDLTSNLLGSYFPTYIKETRFPLRTTMVGKLEHYLRALGFVEKPLDIAPNAASLRNMSLYGEEYETTPPSVRDFTYTPRFTLPHTPTELDKKIDSFIFGF